MPEFTIELNDEPQVLIMHTHTTESFEPFERDFFDSSFNYRTTDPSKNVVMIGDKITQQLENAGIGVIHDTTIHDYPSYNGSYDRSAETVTRKISTPESLVFRRTLTKNIISQKFHIDTPVFPLK